MPLSNRNLNIDSIPDLNTKNILRKAFEDIQDRQLTSLTSIPTVKDIDEREIRSFESGDNKRLYTKASDTIISFLGAINNSAATGDVLTIKDITGGTLRYIYVEGGVLKVASAKP